MEDSFKDCQEEMVMKVIYKVQVLGDGRGRLLPIAVLRGEGTRECAQMYTDMEDSEVYRSKHVYTPI